VCLQFWIFETSEGPKGWAVGVSNKFTKITYYSIEIGGLFSMIIFFSKVNVRKKNIDNDVQMFSLQRPESHVTML